MIPATGSGAVVPGWPPLHPTTQSAFNEILWKRGLPRVEVARTLGVSRARLTAITKDLEEHGLVSAGRREQRSPTGRPAEMLFANLDRYHFLGVHIGAREVVAAAVDLANEVVWTTRTPLDGDAVPDVAHLARVSAVQAVAAGYRVAGVGVTIERPAEGEDGGRAPVEPPGRFVVEGTELAVWVDDDVTALTAFEQWPRLRPGERSMVLLAVGAEVRAGVVVDQAIMVGAHGAAGRIAHLVVDPDGPVCPLGHRGCLWALAAEQAVVAAVPGARGLRDVARRADRGDEAAGAALDRAARGLGLAAGALVRVLDPDRLLLAGESATILRGRETALRGWIEEAAGGDLRSAVEVAEPDSVGWAQAAGAFAQYRTFTVAAG